MITIQKLKVAEYLSQETTAMTCEVLWEGRRIGFARNEGNGGCTFIDFDGKAKREDYAAAEAYAKTQPNLDIDGTQFVYDGKPSMHTLDTLVDDIVGAEHSLKKSRTWTVRALKTKTVFIVGNEVRYLRTVMSPAAEAQIRKNYGDVLIVNPLPIDDAVKAVHEAHQRATMEEVKRFRKER